ncbi:polysaccharide deacetylase family protein [Sungkyunkwania multivorans]|uniref:Polysaccharide deacetylase family protein n=1 Tax=Sungkyunkwania multivorans TaxID=1173618 RepID=A0ABW3CTI4_9FLAO
MSYISPKIPWLLRKSFPSYLWRSYTKEKILYLTFDDGPIPEITERVLDILKDFNAKATFFCIGDNVDKYPAILKRILTEKHAVGNHTYNHVKGWKCSNEAYLSNVLEAEVLLESFIRDFKKDLPNRSKEMDMKLFRPPYGQITPTQARMLQKLGYTIVMWDVVAIDWKSEISQDKVVDNVLKNAKEGSVVIFHDSVKASKNMLYALPKVLTYYHDRGFTFRAISPRTLA